MCDVCKTSNIFAPTCSSTESNRILYSDMVTPIYRTTTILLWEASEILQRLVRHPAGRELNHKAHFLM